MIISIISKCFMNLPSAPAPQLCRSCCQAAHYKQHIHALPLALFSTLVPNLGINCPILVMGTFYLGLICLMSLHLECGWQNGSVVEQLLASGLSLTCA